MDNGINKNYISWEEAFTGLCKLFSLRSKYFYKRTGSCIVDSKNRIMSLGYNGLPFGCNDDDFPHDKNESIYDDGDTYMISSIINAILIARRNLEGCTLYTTDFPDSESTKVIIQNGINKVFYINDGCCNNDDYIASLKMLKASNIGLQQLDDINVECVGKNLITWEEAFVGLCNLVSMRSKDPNTKVGSCIVDSKNRVISLGYNGLPFGCNDNDFPWGCRNSEHSCDTKYPYIVHAEPNAINIALGTSPHDLNNARMYVNLFPCSNCAKKIIQVGLKEIFYVSDKYHDTDDAAVARRMLDAAGIIYTQIPDVEISVSGYQKTCVR